MLIKSMQKQKGKESTKKNIRHKNDEVLGRKKNY